MSLSIAGKTAIVTGAARGIGLAIARHFQNAGANVVYADSDEAALEAELGEEARKEGPARIFVGNLCEKLAIANLLSSTISAFDRVDILVNGARRWATGDALDPAQDQVEALWRENLLTSLRLSQMTAKRMIAQAEKSGHTTANGSIINLSSLASSHTHPDLLGYSIAAAGVEQMTRAMALALAPKGIRVNAISFASVMSGSLLTALKEHPDWRDGIVDGTPLGRIANPDTVVETVQFLASDASGFVTGQVLGVDGGRSLVGRVQEPAY